MQLHSEDLGNTIRKISFSGRLDIVGTGQIESQLTSIALMEDGQRIIFDLSDVDYLASIGLGCIVRTVQSVVRKHGNAVLYNPQPLVAKVISASGVDARIPVRYSMQDAESLLLAGDHPQHT